MNKKIIAIILCLFCFLTAFTGCDGNGDSVESSDTVAFSQSETEIETETEVSTLESETEKKNEILKKEPVNMWTVSYNNKVRVRDIVIDSGKGGEQVTIIQLTDLHFNGALTDNDKTNPTLVSTSQYRKWLKNGGSVANAKRVLDYADSQNPDQIVVTGDVLDYLSEGCMKLMKENLWDRYRNADTGLVEKLMVCLGNHEPVQKMEGKVGESLSLDDRMEMLEEFWEHDPYYSSKVIKNKVMLIQMDNASTGSFRESQVSKLTADLATARANGYVVLMFYHIPIATYNIDEYNLKALYSGDSSEIYNFANSGATKWGSGVNAQICQLIVNNGDIIKGTFCGHLHNDFYTEIIATSPSGNETRIPQYVLVGSPYDNGHALKITVK